MKSDKPKKILILFLAAALLCTSCGKEKEKEEKPAAAEATTMSLIKTEGTVDIEDRDGKSIEPFKNLKLYSGYDMSTQKTSYAWINLDRVKLAKMDEKSEVKIQKDEKRLEIRVDSGSLFFHVEQPLKDDEQMNIRDSTMAVGIRGTCGWTVRKSGTRSQVYILEGEVTVEAKDGRTEKVRPGRRADVKIDKKGRSKIAVSEFKVKDIPEFIMEELIQDRDLAAEILDASGLDVLNPDSEEESAQEAYDAVTEEYRDLAADIRNFASDPRNLTEDGRIDYSNWMTNYYDTYVERYPNTSSGYMEFINGDVEFYSAFYDLDGNGVNELIVGYYQSEDDSFYPISVHTFDGTEAVIRDTILSEVLGDGLILDVGNGYVSGSVYRIGSDGHTWEEVNDSGIPRGVYVRELDLSAHGGLLKEALEWTPLD